MNSNQPTKKLSVAELIEKARAAHAERLAAAVQNNAPGLARRPATTVASPPNSTQHSAAPKSLVLTQIAQAAAARNSGSLLLNERQQEAVERGMRGQSFVLIGAAGTGKTTTTQELIKLLQQSAHMRPFADSTKHLAKDAPGFVIVGYTNKAVNNLKKKLPPHLQSHCITMHKLIEFAPEFFTVCDEEGNERNSMRFTPSRNAANPLPHISTIIFEESSMIGTDLYGQVLDALPRPDATQMIFLGDIFQLPPVFGPSILGFKMSELPVVELTHVYRQALESPIISLATAVRLNALNPWISSKHPLKDTEYFTSKVIEGFTVNSVDAENPSSVTIRPWKKRLSAPSALKTIITLMTKLSEAGDYDPQEDQILCPFNVTFGTVELNKGIADYLGKKREAIVFEIIARYQRNYFAVGDRVMVDRHEAEILRIEPTIGYLGKPTQPESTTLDRWGQDSNAPKAVAKTADEILNELDALAEAEDDGKNLASHSVTVWISDLGEERKLTTAGEINSLAFGYAITVHKSQGSEWRRVFILLHSSHQTMVSRELLYTAITRAKEELYIICEGDINPYKNQLFTGSQRAVVPGTTLAEKIEYFSGKKASMQSILN